MDVSKLMGKNKKKKFKAKNNLLDGNLYEEKLSCSSKYTTVKNMPINKPSSSSLTKKVKNKKRKKSNPNNNNTLYKFSNAGASFSEKPNKDNSENITSYSSSLLSKKKSVKNIDHKVSGSPKNITFSNSKKNKFLNKKQKNLFSDCQNSDKFLKSKKIKCLKSSQKPIPAKTHTESKDINTQIVHKINTESENTSLSGMSEESEASCDEFNQYENQNNNEDDTDEDLEIRNELKGLNVFREIKKLRKDNPMLFSKFCIASESDIVEMKETEQSSNSDTNTSNKLKGNLSKTSKEFSKYPSDTFKTSDTDVKKYHENNVQTYQQENMLQRDYSHKSGKTSCSSTLRSKAQEKLQAAKFRFLNEKLYTESGKDSFTYFQKNNDEFLDYHTGYNLQVLKWPMNPVNKIISSLQKLDKKLAIADMGCGDAKIAQTLTDCVVHSFDLVALNEHVTPCNISKVPLSNDTVDVVVFCLSLMGTNLKDYLLEAFRILKYGGVLKIAEVESRIPNLDKFVKSIESLGFTLDSKDIQHKLFVFLDFKKDKKRKKTQDVVLNPCLYKKR